MNSRGQVQESEIKDEPAATKLQMDATSKPQKHYACHTVLNIYIETATFLVFKRSHDPDYIENRWRASCISNPRLVSRDRSMIGSSTKAFRPISMLVIFLRIQVWSPKMPLHARYNAKKSTMVRCEESASRTG